MFEIMPEPERFVVTDEHGMEHVMCDGDGLDVPTPFCELYEGHDGPHCAGYIGSNRKDYWYTGKYDKRRGYPF